MSEAEIIAEHVLDARFLLDSLTREERRRGPLVMQIQAARFFGRIRTSLALQSVRIETQAQETRTALGIMDAKVAALARGV